MENIERILSMMEIEIEELDNYMKKARTEI